MKSFNFVIRDELGIHARPAGLLVKEAGKYASQITLTKEGKAVECTKLMRVMSLAVKQGNEVTVSAEGEDEDVAIEELQKFFEENL